jgi:hypothetical protein
MNNQPIYGARQRVSNWGGPSRFPIACRRRSDTEDPLSLAKLAIVSGHDSL